MAIGGYVDDGRMRANTLAIGFSILLGIASGLAEPPGTVAGAAIICSSALLLPWGLDFALG